MISTTEESAKVERETLSRLRNGFVDGIIIAGTGANGRLVRDIKSSGLPVAQVVRRQERDISSVVADYEACAHDGTMFLADKGCMEIGLINGSMDIAPYLARYKGYKKAIAKRELPEITTTCTHPWNSFEYGYQCAGQLLDENPKLDAIMAAVDVQGLGAMRAIKERGLRVPEDVSVMGYDGIHLAQVLGLTTYWQDTRQIGKIAAERLISLIEHPKTTLIDRIMVSGKLLEGTTVRQLD